MTRCWLALKSLLLVMGFGVNVLNGQNINSFQGSPLHEEMRPRGIVQTLQATLQPQPHPQSHFQFQPVQQQQHSPSILQQQQPPQYPLPLPVPKQQQQQQQPHSYYQQINERICDLIAEKVLNFALDIGRDLSANQYYSKSEVFSPMSIVSAIALLLLGSRGESYNELASIFGLSSDPELQQNPALFHQEFGKILKDLEEENSGFVLDHRKNVNWQYANNMRNIRVQKDDRPIEHIIKIANGIFTQSGFSLNPYYKDVVTSIYRSELSQLDFYNNANEATDFINKWVSRKTFGRIPSILNSPVIRDTKVILASALYFKAFWENTFFVEATNDDKFFPDGERAPAIKVKMMATGGLFPFYDAAEYNCRIIGLPYRGNLTTMYIIQPQHSSRENLRALQDSLNAQKIEDMISKMSKKTAVLALPKMHVVRTTNMKNILKQLNIKSIFSGSSSDISLIENAEAPPVYYSGDIDAQRKAAEPISGGGAAFQGPTRPRERPMKSDQNIAFQFNIRDRYNERPLIFVTRFGGGADNSTQSQNETATATDTGNTVAPADASTDSTTAAPITVTPATSNAERCNKTETDGSRPKRQLPSTPAVPILSKSLEALEAQRFIPSSVKRSDLFVEEILHKVDFDVNEHGTEAAAATLTYLKRSGTDILFRADTPFLVLIRHDPTKMVLFYGIINEPEV